MKIIVGLGNPGNKYETTRHNAGFLAIDHYLKDKQAIACQSKFQAQICELHTISLRQAQAKNTLDPEPVEGHEKTFFVKPTTFMNLSGEAVLEITNFYKIDFKKDLLVIHDEIDLPFGEIRTTDNSRAAGHNGVQNIIDLLGTQEFQRIRIGVESRENKTDVPTPDYVLSHFSEEELTQLEKETLPKVGILIEDFLNK